MPTPEERMEILDRLERGEITPEQAAQLLSQETPGEPKPPEPETAMGVLEQLERGEIDTEEAARRLSSKAAAAQRAQPHKRREGASTKVREVEVFQTGKATPPKQKREWWLVPMMFGVLFTVLAALWMRADAANGIGLGFVCAWLPLGIGLMLILLAVISRNGPWARMQVNSRKASGRVNFVMDMPVPVGVATTALKTAGRYVPGIDETDVEKMTEAFVEIQRTGNPIHIRANDEDDDDVVDITIG